jgi:hypothetical protein
VVDHCTCPKNWHLSIQPGEAETCTNDLDYPESWHKAPGHFLFRSAEECCLENFDDEDCKKRDVCLTCVDTWHVNPDKPGSSW